MSGFGEIERRFAVAEIRAAGRRVQGYAATFGAEADLGGGLSEVIRQGAFQDALRTNPDILALLDHDVKVVLGRTRSGSLKLAEDERGLNFSLDLPATRAADDVLALAATQNLGGMSFGFFVPKGGESWQGSKRTLNKIDLREISIVQSIPAYAGTEIAVRFLSHIPDNSRRQRVLILAEMQHWGS